MPDPQQQITQDPYAKYGGKAVDPYAKYQKTEAKAPAPAETPIVETPPPQTFADKHPYLAKAGTVLRGIIDLPANLQTGAAKGAASTGYNLADWTNAGLRKAGNLVSPELTERFLPAFPAVKPPALEPKGYGEKAGYLGEQVGEFFIPGPQEVKLAGKIAEYAPALGKFAAPLGRTLAAATSTGLVNKAQGGGFTEGAAAGGVLGGLGEAGKAVAPALAETALGITKRLRGFGKTPGKAALEEIRGVSPGTLAENARTKLGELTRQLEAHAANSKVPTSTDSALKVLDREQAKALSQNNRTVYDQLHAIREQLSKDLFSGQPLADKLPAAKLLDLKRGIGSLEKSWNPEQRGVTKGIVRQVYSALDKELDRAVPQSAKLNQRISSLIPVATRAASVERGAGLSQRTLGRFARPTGALVGAGLGGYQGYREGGPTGALLGGLGGLVLPEVISSPTVQMQVARSLHSGGPRLLGRKTLFPTIRALSQENKESDER
jgi:hypothetical protein